MAREVASGGRRVAFVPAGGTDLVRAERALWAVGEAGVPS